MTGAPARSAWIAAGLIAAALFLVCGAIAGPFVLDTDVVNLAMAVERFDVREHQPHPPGYLGYVAVLRAVHALSGLAPLAVARLVSRAFAALAVLLTCGAASRLAPGRRAVAAWSAALLASHPVALYYGIDGQTHSAEAALAAGLLWALLAARERPTVARCAAVGLLLAAGGSLRASFALIALLPAFWALRRAPRALLVAGVVAALGTLAWLVPTARLSGGYDAYRAASDALITDAYVRTTSVLSPRRVPAYVTNNVRNALAWSALALSPAALAGILALVARVVRAARARDARSPEPESDGSDGADASAAPGASLRSAALLLALMTLPVLGFSVLMFCAEPGYLAGLVPPSCVLAARLLAQVRDASAAPRPLARLAPGALLVGAQLTFFLLGPARVGPPTWLPTLDQVATRHARAELLVRWIVADTRPDERLLVVSDFTNNTVLRELPLLRARTECLFLHSARYEIFASTTLSLAGAHGWRAAPGPSLLHPGPPTVLATDAVYDTVVVDPRSSDALLAELSSQTRCPIRRGVDAPRAPHLPVRECFPDGVLRLAPHALRFRVE